MRSEPAGLPEVRDVAQPIIERAVWATVATVGPDGAPRTRLMHPVWFWDGEVPSALVSARPTPLKVAHIAAQPAVSCFYWDPAHDTVAVDAHARWVPDADRSAAWERIRATAEPVGFDPAVVWPDGPESDDCGFLRLTAHRVLATTAGATGVRWTAP